MQGIWRGEHLPGTVEALGIDPAKVLFAPQYPYNRGMLSPKWLNRMYNAADVYLSTSHGERFQIPLIEAQAAGLPVIVSNFSAMAELSFNGNLIQGKLAWHMPGMKQFIPDVDSIVRELERAYIMVKEQPEAWEECRERAQELACGYDYRTVFENYMLPAIEAMGLVATGQADEREARTKQRVALREKADESCEHGHSWASTGLYDNNGDVCYPCKRKGCTAEKRVNRDHKNGRINETGFSTSVNGIDLDIDDDPEGGVAKIICREIEQSYKLDDIPFHDGETVIDVGAHVGVVSIYLAKKYPGITVYAFEPVRANYERLLRNIEANMVKNVIPHNIAVSGLGKTLELRGNADQNSGGFSAMIGDETKHLKDMRVVIDSITLPKIFQQYKIDRVKLLKIDCEGMEYEILGCHEEMLDSVDYLVGEFHVNKAIQGRGNSPTDLLEMVGRHLPKSHIQVNLCQIAD